LAIGLLLVWVTEGPPTPWWLRPLLAVGAIGGFTTFSALAIEAVLLSDESAVTTAGLYVGFTVVLGLLAVWLSATLTRRLLLSRGRGETHP
jgi:CrcB protein